MKYGRTVQSQQDSILDKNLELKSGVFEDYFKQFHLLDKRRGLFTRLLNKNLLTEWQAVEILQGDIFLICAVFKFGIMNRTLLFLYDINNQELHNYSSTSYLKDTSHVAPSLEHKDLSTRKTVNTLVNICNELDKGMLHVNGKAEELTFDVTCKRIATPSVVSVPMTKKHTVYTEKDLFVPEGKIVFRGKEYPMTESSITILDDHRGYYPLTSGYDWATCMGNIVVNKEPKKFGINLTSFYKNVDADKFCENGYWLEGKFHQLPNVTFTRKNNKWYIKDDEGVVDIVFTNQNFYNEQKPFPIKIDYTLAFGTLSGSIQTNSGTLDIESMFALGEKRITKFIK